MGLGVYPLTFIPLRRTKGSVRSLFKRFRDLVLGVIIGALAVTGVMAAMAGDGIQQGSIKDPFSPRNMAILRQARAIIDLYHVDADKLPGEQKLFYGAMKGMVAAAGDPYTRFVDPSQLKEESIEMEGQYGGVGMYVGQRDGKVLVISPMEGTPAERAGLKPMDEIVKVGDKIVVGMNQDEVVNMLRGPAGTKVTVWVRRKGKDEIIKFDLIREIIKIRSVRKEMLKDKYAYVRLAHFTQTAGQEMAEAVAWASSKGAKGIVLDLRNNPGGLLNAAADVASCFLNDGDLVVSTKGRVDRANEAMYASGRVKFKGPLVVLINEGSASASEIVAGALKDHGRAKLVGVKSFGKGSVQTLFNLPDGAGMYVTIARYYTPSGRMIDKVGLNPDVKVSGEPMGDLAKDPQVRKGVEILKSMR
ncbi:C-terminal processing peptidase [Thermanaerovibrio velox DSM 12556]|uniref:C-terminal processing peptidase n=1 Tax=Thermanaerovibrio velox DSM 12556 TaxID=926567 RepID=H0UNM1_9BACT|nr:C-terminal processing peptidase [Thermanaerovibrio velox DSM 12556]